MQPVIKWSGSKRSQAERIVELAPRSFSAYYEPFIGGGSVLYAMNPNIAVCGDICKPLIALWNEIKESPDELARAYEANWLRLQAEGHEVFYEIRDHFNRNKDAESLLFLSRTCVNGLIRFNKNGDFNNSLHHTRPGIKPERLEPILHDWSKRVSGASFLVGDYRDTTSTASSKDFVYLDPPYFNTKGRYYGGIDFNEFLSYLEDLNSRNIKFALSFDGARGGKDFTAPMPEDLYKRKVMLSSGNSPFKKLQDKQTEQVFESLYLNY